MILAISTSSFQFSFALLDRDGSLKAEYTMAKGAGRFTGMFPAFEDMLSALGAPVREVTGIAVAIGPGSFTGLRVGLAAAKGFAHGLEAPLVGISSLEALACQLTGASMPVAAMLDARRGEVFTALFDPEFPYPERKTEDACVMLKELPSHYPEPAIVIGNDYSRQAPLLQEVFGGEAVLAPPHLWNIRASAVGFLGVRRLRSEDHDDPESLSPVYLRPADIHPNAYTDLLKESEEQEFS